MKAHPGLEAIEAYADGEIDLGYEDIEAHLAMCPACRNQVARTRKMNAWVKAAARRRMASPELLNRLARGPVTGNRQTARRQILLGGGAALAASLSAVWAWPRLIDLENVRPAYLATILFGDFATFLAADRSLDLTSSDTAEIDQWLAPNLPFAMPAIPSGEGLKLLGARLCWLMDRRVASLVYVHKNRLFGFYVHSAANLLLDASTDLPAAQGKPLIRQFEGLSAAVWRRTELVQSIVGQGDAETIAMIAGMWRQI